VRKMLLVVALLAVLLAVLSTPAGAGAPTQGRVTLEILMDYEFPGGGPFTADAIVYPSGYAQDRALDVPLVGNPPGSGTSVLLKEQKAFTCDNGEGSFTLEFITVLKWDKRGTQGEWRVVEGTGAYEDLKGNGTFKVQWLADPNLEVWEGHMVLP
jgi:hypothetical protein